MQQNRAMEEACRNVLLIDDEEDVLFSGRQTLELEGLAVQAFRDAKSALGEVSAEWPGIVVTDVKMPRMDGMEVLQRVKSVDPELPVILITGHGDVTMALRAVREGAYDFLEKPAAPELLVDVVRRALEKRSLILENRSLHRELESITGIDRRIVGRSEAVETVRKTIANIADTAVDVLVEGETGTGKELVARCLHDLSGRHGEKFVALNCGALPETIIESELFGHESGAFTGADKRRIGKFEFAHGGTLFLDEIESMPLNLQVKLLRVLQERAVERLGGNETIPIDVRVIAAAKADLLKMSEAGEFREDLYYRLNVARIRIPPLRERHEDIPLLFLHFIQKACQRFGRSVPDVPALHFVDLMARPWPGNVRELGNAAERYVLGLSGMQSAGGPIDLLDGSSVSLEARMEAFEKQVISGALRRNGGRIGQTAVDLGIPRKKLYLRMRRHGLHKEDFIGPDRAR